MGSVGHGAWLVLEEPGHAPLPVASALGCGAVEVPQIQFLDFVVVEAVPGYTTMRQTTETCGRVSLGFLALFALGKQCLYDLVSGSFFLGAWVMHEEYETLDSSGDDFVCGEQCLGRRWLHVLHQYLAFG